MPYAYDEMMDDLLDEDQVIEEVLGENPRATELRLLRAALEQRRDYTQRALTQATDDRERVDLTTRLKELRRQIAALRHEEEITAFVETSVRFTLHTPDPDEFA